MRNEAEAEETLRLANEAAADDKAEALRLAKVDADAALKLVQDELAGIRRDLANEIAEKEAKEASDMAKAVLEAIRLNTPEAFMADSPATVKASSAGVLTATQSGYTMSAAPEEIVGWRGRTLENDGDTTVIYTNIENAAATPIRRLYRSASDTAELAVHYNVLAQLDSDMNKDILWADAKRADEDSATTGTGGGDAETTFAGSVRGLEGTFSCTGAVADCGVPVPGDDGAINSTATWTFTPTDPNGTIDVPNPAYVSFGWWLNAMGTEGDYEFEAFASVNGMTMNGESGRDLEGSATYKGAAAGKYAILSTTDDSASGGHFTAAATLKANFDADSDATDADVDVLGVSIGGTITDFMTGETSRPNWKVTLTTPV